MHNSEPYPQNYIDQIKKNFYLSGIPTDMLAGLLDNPYEGLILIDTRGIIRFVNNATDGAYLKPARDCIGCHISEISPESKMLRVIKTGRAEIVRSMTFNNKDCMLLRFPLMKNGRIIGVAGKFLTISPENIKELYDRIDDLKNNLDYYKKTLNQLYCSRYTFDNIIGNSLLIKKVKALALQTAKTDSSVLITGESGTGKELLAHSIHHFSHRKNNNFVSINCASIPEELIESELFGYTPGAFTDASKQGKIGKFELANKGTMFLDEIGDMRPIMQVKLMRVLQEKVVERIGGKPEHIDFRLISATNRNLESMMQKKDFRLDLFYRLNVVSIKMPALRDIKEDIPLIFYHFLDKFNPKEQRPDIRMSPEVLKAIQLYSWPGNVRELKNVVERATIICRGNQIKLDDLPVCFRKKQFSNSFINTPSTEMSLKDLMEKTEQQAIINALKKTGNNKVKAAKLLNIHRTGLYQKTKKYNIT